MSPLVDWIAELLSSFIPDGPKPLLAPPRTPEGDVTRGLLLLPGTVVEEPGVPDTGLVEVALEKYSRDETDRKHTSLKCDNIRILRKVSVTRERETKLNHQTTLKNIMVFQI